MAKKNQLNPKDLEKRLDLLIKRFEEQKGIINSYVKRERDWKRDKVLHKKELSQLEKILSKESNNDLGNKISMHIAASNPLAIDKDGLKKEVIDKELEIITEEITNSGKPKEVAEKILKEKISKFINENTLLNQIWIMDPKKKVSDILKENKVDKEVKILDFIRYKVGEGV